MKNIQLIKSTLLLLLSILSPFIYGQSIYRTGFDTDAEKAGWVEFRNGKLGNAKWEIGSKGSSAPSCIIHYAPTGDANKDTLKNWYVSPKFDFSEGGVLDSVSYNYFAAFETFFPEQAVIIYLLVGSNDPAKASSKIELADLSSFYSGDVNLWRDTGNFQIPNTNGNSYIAFNFVAVDGWSSISFDDIKVISNKTSSIQDKETQSIVTVFPNPASEFITIESNTIISEVTVINSVGQHVLYAEGNRLDVSSLPAGQYYLDIKDKNNRKFTKTLIRKR